jgi:hypothetical protein
VSGATAAWWTLVAGVLLGLASLVPHVIGSLRARIDRDKAQAEHDREMLELARVRARREAAFDAGLAMETKELTGPEKLAGAVQMANDVLTPPTITVSAADVEAALPRVRASLATPTSSFPPPAGGGGM